MKGRVGEFQKGRVFCSQNLNAETLNQMYQAGRLDQPQKHSHRRSTTRSDGSVSVSGRVGRVIRPWS